MEKRVALVIGNGKYRYGPRLANPHKDAETIAGVLGRLGFELTRSQSPAVSGQGWHTDLDLISMKRLLADFSYAAEKADMAVVYFAGHGMEIDGQNYLLPVDAELDHVRRVRAETASLQEIVDDVAAAKTLPFIILDACRDNPFLERMRGLDQGRSFRSGLSDIKFAGNLFVAYAAHQGAKAQDGPVGGNSPFAKALAEHLETPDIDIRVLMGAVRDDVRDATKHVQFPHIYGSLGRGAICLKRSAQSKSPETEGVTPPPPSSSLDWSAAEWGRIKDTTDVGQLKRFAEHAHPYYAGEARERVRLLEAEAQRHRAEAERREREERERKAEEDRRRAEGRIEIDAPIVTNPQGRWFLPGAGKTESFKDFDAGPEMVVVSAGSFMMGSPANEPERESWKEGTETPQHKVTIAKPFAIGRHAITRGQFAAFVNATGHKTDGGAVVWNGKEFKLDPSKSWRDPGFAQDDRHPVVCVNWEDAQAYTKWLSQKTGKTYRLPSEAEWEYVCRAGTVTPFWWGSSITPAQANYNGNYTYAGGGSKGEYRQKTVPVDSVQANPWGLYQVHGNVWEWCEDVWHDSYEGAPADGAVWSTGGGSSRVLRGGSWNFYPQNLRSANRYVRNTSDFRFNYIGFRVSRTLNL